jgi:hypothetical protein
MVVFQEHFGLAKGPTIHLKFYQQQSAVIPRCHNMLIPCKSQKAVPVWTIQRITGKKKISYITRATTFHNWKLSSPSTIRKYVLELQDMRVVKIYPSEESIEPIF